MGRCLKCNHYDICDNDRIHSEEVWGGCRYFEDDSIPMVAKSEYDALTRQLEKTETETAKKIFADLEAICSLYQGPDNIRLVLDIAEIIGLKKKYKVEE